MNTMVAEEPVRVIHNRKLLEKWMADHPAKHPPVAEQAKALPLDTSTLPANAYNPSIIKVGDHLWLTYRYHFKNDSRTKLGIAEVVNGVVINPRDLSLYGNSLEDARLFHHQAEPWMSWVQAEINPGELPTCVVKYASLDPTMNIGRIYQVDVGGNDGQHMEKNWCFFDSDENLFCVYASQPEYLVLQIQGSKVVNEYKTARAIWPYGAIRGGTILPHDGKLLRFFHSWIDDGMDQREVRYYVGALLMEPRPPFTVMAISQTPILSGAPSPTVDCFHYKPNVVFPCGAMRNKDGFILSLGINDTGCLLTRIGCDQLHL